MVPLLSLLTVCFAGVVASPLQPPSASVCRLTPDSPPKVYRWTPERPVNLWELAGRFQGDLVGQEVLSRGERCVLKQGVDYWPNAQVPVDIKKEEFGWTDLRIIKKAFRIIEDKTCIRFPPKNESHTSFIELKGNLGAGECWSYLGKLTGNQTLSLGEGCVNLHHVLHEICHALGLVHQHSAPDRDAYIHIHWDNIDPEFLEWFDKYTWDEYTDFDLGYDLYSVMHYSAYIASKNGKPTISAKDPTVKIEERTTLSEKDIEKLNIIYCSGDVFPRKTNFRTFGGFIVDLVDDLPTLTRHLLAVVTALSLLAMVSLVGHLMFSRLLVLQPPPEKYQPQVHTMQGCAQGVPTMDTGEKKEKKVPE